jgi:hypothetical protein
MPTEHLVNRIAAHDGEGGHVASDLVLCMRHERAIAPGAGMNKHTACLLRRGWDRQGCNGFQPQAKPSGR